MIEITSDWNPRMPSHLLPIREAGPVNEPRDEHGRWTSGGSVTDVMKRIGKLHADATNTPDDPATKAAYHQFINETL